MLFVAIIPVGYITKKEPENSTIIKTNIARMRKYSHNL